MTREERELADHVAHTVIVGMRHILADSLHQAIDEMLVRQWQAKVAPEIAIKEAFENYIKVHLLRRNMFLSIADLEKMAVDVQRHIPDQPLEVAIMSAIERHNRAARGEQVESQD